jgi:iron complex transport system substrate-binding protein
MPGRVPGMNVCFARESVTEDEGVIPAKAGVRRWAGRASVVCAGALAISACAVTGIHAAPQRIVSLNLCTDELLLRLVPRERIASVTWLARDAGASNVAAQARSVPVNHGSAEEVIPSAPDLVLVGDYTTIAATSLLRRTGFHVTSFSIPASFDAVRRQVAAFGKAVGAEAEADSLANEIDEGLAAAAGPAAAPMPRALVLNPNGVTMGPGTLADTVMRRAGLDNIAARLPLGGYDQVPLEVLAGLDIDVLVVSSTAPGAPSLATGVLQHPVLQALRKRMVVVDLPGRLWSCAGPGLVEAVARLRAAADAARAREVRR